MTAKTSEARRKAFIVAVRETGNQTLAAERAKVSRSWVGKVACFERIEAAQDAGLPPPREEE